MKCATQQTIICVNVAGNIIIQLTTYKNLSINKNLCDLGPPFSHRDAYGKGDRGFYLNALNPVTSIPVISK